VTTDFGINELIYKQMVLVVLRHEVLSHLIKLYNITENDLLQAKERTFMLIEPALLNNETLQ